MGVGFLAANLVWTLTEWCLSVAVSQGFWRAVRALAASLRLCWQTGHEQVTEWPDPDWGHHCWASVSLSFFILLGIAGPLGLCQGTPTARQVRGHWCPLRTNTQSPKPNRLITGKRCPGFFLLFCWHPVWLCFFLSGAWQWTSRRRGMVSHRTRG